MPASGAEDFRLTVLNPGGRDPAQDFSRKSALTEPPHAPVNFHAYAACTNGLFQRDLKSTLAGEGPVLVLIRGDFRESLQAVHSLKKQNRAVAVALKETGAHQIAAQLADSRRLALFREILAESDGCIASTPDAVEIYRASSAGVVQFIPTPYPLDEAEWNFAATDEDRAGIFIGTREFEVPSRRHLAALLLARTLSADTGEPVTVCNADGRRGARLLAALGFSADRLRVIEKRLPYRDHLKLMAAHRIVLQLDSSSVPGQVAGDALLCRLPCVGGDGAIERIAFPSLNSFGRTPGEIGTIAARLLRDQLACTTAVQEAQKIAAEQLSFAVVAHRLRSFFDSLGGAQIAQSAAGPSASR